ncbi:hypothetical protein J2S07_003624 [Robertmurraya andreesenii]|uniref:Uncharacterized protein n=1 Tax=Anoxybacillus andreesenii TaxID=1325932 RepID=A0ABT9V8N0_9BACL|nr:hypothetical protein [Robertmurraya andreesenii]
MTTRIVEIGWKLSSYKVNDDKNGENSPEVVVIQGQ